MGILTHSDNSLISYDEWKVLRNKGIGASEVGAIVFGSKWSSNLEVFYRKLGAAKEPVENIRMLLGKETEDTTAKMWEYFEDDNESIVKNFRANKPVKKCINLNCTTSNSDYPHLFVTIDREIQPFGKYAKRGKGTLEIKNTTGYALKSYENGLPLDNVAQICTQMMVGEYSYGCLYYFIDNMRFEEHEIDRSSMKRMEQIILDITTPFWENVIKGRKIFNQIFEARRTYNFRLVAELETELAQLEPPPQLGDGYLNFLSQKYKDRIAGTGIIPGTESQLLIAKKHKELGRKADKLIEDQKKLEIELKNIIKNNNCLDFGKNGKVSWYANKNDKRIFRNLVK